jgi:hypothetical protein
VIVDNGGNGYSETGSWTTETVPSYGGNERYATSSGTGQNTATWQVPGLPSGLYQVQVSWHPYPNQAANAPYAIYDGSTLLQTVLVNQTQAASGASFGGVPFQTLAIVNIASGTLKVALSNTSNGTYIVADAVRVAPVTVSSTDLNWSASGDGITGPTTVNAQTPFTISRTYNITGAAAPGNYTISYYASSSPSSSQDLSKATLLGSETLSAAADLAVGNHARVSPMLQLPSGGTYYLVAKLIADPSWAESDSGNDTNDVAVAAQPVQVSGPMIVDNGTAGYSETGTWATESVPAYGGTERYATSSGTGQNTATWLVTGLASGFYQLQVSWHLYPNEASNAPYAIYDGSTLLQTVVANQTQAANGSSYGGVPFQTLATVQITSGTLKVVLSNAADGTYVVADAVRVAPVQVSNTDLNWSAPGDGITGPVAVNAQTPFTISRTYNVSGAAAPGSFIITYYASTSSSTSQDLSKAILLGSETLSAAADLVVGDHSGTSPSLQFASGGTYYLFAKLSSNGFMESDGAGDSNDVAVTAQPVQVSGPVIVDNGSAGYSETGTWATETVPSFGGTERYATSSGTGQNTATWQVTALASGFYQVQVSWHPYPNEATNAPYAIYDGSTLLQTLAVNQTQAANGSSYGGVPFQALATVQIASGTLKVVLSNAANGTYVVADAVRVAPVQVSGPPTVTTVSPTNGSTGVAIGTSVTVTFSEAMDSTTIGTSTILLKNPSNTSVPATVAYNAATDTATLAPTSSLAYSTTYTAVVVGGSANPHVQDVNGNALAANYTWTFTTVAPPPAANAGSNLTTNEGTVVTFAGSVTGGTAPLTYSWTFGDNGTANGTLTPTHTYVNKGSYTATLTVTDALSRSSQASATVTVNDVSPTAKITGIPSSATVGTAITLGNTVTSPSPLDTAAGFTYAWSVTKNGAAFASGAAANFTFTPDSVATFVVTLTATDKDSQTGSDTATIVTGNASNGLTVPQAHARIWWTAARLAAAKQWYAANPFTPSSTDALNNALLYVLTGNNTNAQNAISQLMNFTISSSELAGVASDNYRWGQWVPIVYDWCYNAMTAAQQQTFMTRYNGYTDIIMQKSWGGPGMPASNYFWGYLSNEFNWAIATYYENAKAQTYLQDALVTRWQNSFLPYAASGDALGGAPAEGSQYGPYMLSYPMTALTTAALMGSDLFQKTNFYKEALFQTIYSTTPSSAATGYYQTFWYGDDETDTAADSSYLGDFMTAMAQEWANVPAGQYARQWLNTVQPAVDNYVLSTDPGGAALNFSSLPTDYYAPGAGYLYTRDQWGAQGTSLVLQLGQPDGDGHQHQDAGSFQMWSNGQWLSTNDRGYSVALADGTWIADTAAQNGLLFNGSGESTQPNAEPQVLRLQSTATYSYAAVDLTPDYRSSDSRYDNPAVNHVEREFLYIKPMKTLVVLDRVDATSAGVTKSFLVHFPNAPTINGNTVIGTAGNQQLNLTSLTSGAAFNVVNEGSNGQYRLAENIAGAAQGYLLNVLQATSVGGPTVAVSMTQNATSWTISLDSAALGHAVIVLQAGMTTNGGTIGYSATGVPTSSTSLLDHVQTIQVTNAGPIWGN